MLGWQQSLNLSTDSSYLLSKFQLPFSAEIDKSCYETELIQKTAAKHYVYRPFFFFKNSTRSVCVQVCLYERKQAFHLVLPPTTNAYNFLGQDMIQNSLIF